MVFFFNTTKFIHFNNTILFIVKIVILCNDVFCILISLFMITVRGKTEPSEVF